MVEHKVVEHPGTRSRAIGGHDVLLRGCLVSCSGGGASKAQPWLAGRLAFRVR